MLSAVPSLSDLLFSNPRIDNLSCWLHHGLTCTLLLLCTLIVTAKQYVGDPINCIFLGIDHSTLDSYCWVQSMFTQVATSESSEVLAHPGVGPEAPGNELRYHAYYRWVCFALFFQAAAMAAPHRLWASYDGGNIKSIADAAVKPEEPQGVSKAARWIKNHKGNGAYTAWMMVFCEALYCALDIAIIFFMDAFLEGEMFRRKFQVFSMSALDEEDRQDALARLFPRVTKCTFRQFGPSGSLQAFDGMCVLPVNIFNEMVYMVLWFWYWILTAAAAGNLIYRLVLVLFPVTRVWRMKIAFRSDTDTVARFVHRATFGQFMLLVSLGRQMGGREEFRQLVAEAAWYPKPANPEQQTTKDTGDEARQSPSDETNMVQKGLSTVTNAQTITHILPQEQTCIEANESQPQSSPWVEGTSPAITEKFPATPLSTMGRQLGSQQLPAKTVGVTGTTALNRMSRATERAFTASYKMPLSLTPYGNALRPVNEQPLTDGNKKGEQLPLNNNKFATPLKNSEGNQKLTSQQC